VTLRATSLLLTVAVATTAAAQPASEADLVLRGGAVHTLDARRTRAHAIAIDDGRIVAVGSDAEIAPWVGPDTEVVELGGRMVLPGFHDAHVHPIAGGMQALSCSLVEAATVDAIQAKVRECAAGAAATAGNADQAWLVGAGWNLSLFPAANPHRSLLDAIVPDRPVFLVGADGHSAWVNSRALALAGIDASTPDPAGGVIERDRPSGAPSGTLRESATTLVSALVPPPSIAAHRAGLRHALRLAASFGITSMIDPGASDQDLEVYREAEASGELTARVLTCAQPEGRRHGELAPELPGTTEIPRGAATARLRSGCVKVFVDGVLEGETAALLEPYLGRGEHRGTLNFEPETLAAALTRWDSSGVQVHLHTIGDRAVRVALDAIEAARRTNGSRDSRHHLAHLQLVDPADVPRFAALGVTATFQALWAYPDTYIEDINLGQVGPERVARMYPIRSIQRAGGRIAGGSDWPVTSMNPLLAIEVALTRQNPAGRPIRPPDRDRQIMVGRAGLQFPTPPAAGDPDTLNATERVDLDTMLAAYTVNGAWLMRHEATTGTIEIGKVADLIVLERDLFAIPAAEIGEVRVARTILGGATVYDGLPIR
jgi:predicted amidohydrolase YtcJ